MVCGVVPQPESCGTDSGTGEIPVFARFSILLYQCTKVTVNIRGVSHPPSPHQATSIISSPYPLPPFGTVVRGTALVLRPRTGRIFRLRPIPPSPLWYSGTWYRTHAIPTAQAGHLTNCRPDPLFRSLVQRYMVRRSGMSEITRQPSTVRERQRHGALQPRTAPATACAIMPK